MSQVWGERVILPTTHPSQMASGYLVTGLDDGAAPCGGLVFLIFAAVGYRLFAGHRCQHTVHNTRLVGLRRSLVRIYHRNLSHDRDPDPHADSLRAAGAAGIETIGKQVSITIEET